MERFWKKVSKSNNGCWLWTGAIMASGYGSFSFDSKTYRAHRISWLLNKGEIPKDLHVLHECDNPKCVNPDHLFLGSHQDNMKDRDRKGRIGGVCSKYGEHFKTLKLTEQQALEIRKDTRTEKQIAETYNISPTYAGQIRRGQKWAYLEKR